jgi:GntR family transcriptional regulator/MocR family aminotransferase
LVAAKNSMDWHCPTPMQATVAEFIAAGHLRRHVRKMRAAYQRRQRVVLEALREDFGQRLWPMESQYGMHVCAAARDETDVEAIAQALQAEGIALHTIERYFFGAPAYRGLVFGYGSASIAQLKRAMAALRKAL